MIKHVPQKNKNILKAFLYLQVRDIYVPENVEIGGDCSEDTARLELKWSDFKLRWYFEKVSPKNYITMTFL